MIDQALIDEILETLDGDGSAICGDWGCGRWPNPALAVCEPCRAQLDLIRRVREAAGR